MRIRLAEGPGDVDRCRALIQRVYRERYGVEVGDGPADPDGGREQLPDRYVLGELDGHLVACAGLYTGTTYVERFGGVDRATLAPWATDVRGRPRPVVEYTKVVVDPAFARRGLGRRFLAASHAAPFLAEGGGPLPLVLICARLTTFRLWEAAGIRTRFLREFPTYRNHARYRSVGDPMESRLVVPELDVPATWLWTTLPRTLPEPALPAAVVHDDVVRSEALAPVASLDLVLVPQQIRAHWRRCWLSAEYLSGALAPGHPQLAVVVAELLENAVKFCADAAEAVTVRVDRLRDAGLRVETRNRCDRDHAEDLGQSVRRVLDADPAALFVEQLERSARSGHRDESRMGFVTLCLHAGARLGLRIREVREGSYEVTVSALLEGEGTFA